MIILGCAILGFVLGWIRAGRAGGDRKDRWQWAMAHALMLTVVGLFVTVIISRSV